MKKTLVIDIGGTFIKYGLIDKKCKLSLLSKVKTPKNTEEELLNTLQQIYIEFKQYGLNGIAISAPGIVDADNGVMVTGGALTYLWGMHLAEKLSKLCDELPVSLENDGKAAVLCEASVGAASTCQSCVVLIFGSGIGGGIVLDGKILRGNSLLAGEFSPVFIDYKKESYECLADAYSTLSIVSKVKAVKNDENMSGEKIIALYKENDEDVVSIVDDWFYAIAKFCYNIDYFINPECICIGGGISAEPLFIEKIIENIEVIFNNSFQIRKPIVKVCKYHNDSNLIGAYQTFKRRYNDIE